MGLTRGLGGLAGTAGKRRGSSDSGVLVENSEWGSGLRSEGLDRRSQRAGVQRGWGQLWGDPGGGAGRSYHRGGTRSRGIPGSGDGSCRVGRGPSWSSGVVMPRVRGLGGGRTREACSGPRAGPAGPDTHPGSGCPAGHGRGDTGRGGR